MPDRTTPFDLVFQELAERRFPALRESVERSGIDLDDPDAFVLDPEVARLLRDLVPDEAPSHALPQHIMLLHHAFLFWRAGRICFRMGHRSTRDLLSASPIPPSTPVAPPSACYIQFPERLLWGRLAPDEPHEPFDGMFLRPRAGGFFLLGIFGVHRGRGGFSVVDAEGYRPEVLEREDGTLPFSPIMPGGATSGLHSLAGENELFELAARSLDRIAALEPTVAGLQGEVIEIP
jgi:hypothetical protein